MAKHDKTLNIIALAHQILTEHRPMTARQVYYQLVSRQAIKNSKSDYNAVLNALVYARKEGIIPWDWIEDRLRKPRPVYMWQGLAEFAEVARRSYRRDVWDFQESYVECWLEKDALSGIFENILSEYGVTLNVGRGYDGWDSIHNAALRFGDGSRTTILYFGDFDPSGVDMTRSLLERLAFFDCRPKIVRAALNLDDITSYNLPPDFAKTSDTRRGKFVAKYGDKCCVELDALPPAILESRLRQELEARLDLDALQAVKVLESEERQRLADLLTGAA